MFLKLKSMKARLSWNIFFDSTLRHGGNVGGHLTKYLSLASILYTSNMAATTQQYFIFLLFFLKERKNACDPAVDCLEGYYSTSYHAIIIIYPIFFSELKCFNLNVF